MLLCCYFAKFFICIGEVGDFLPPFWFLTAEIGILKLGPSFESAMKSLLSCVDGGYVEGCLGAGSPTEPASLGRVLVLLYD